MTEERFTQALDDLREGQARMSEQNARIEEKLDNYHDTLNALKQTIRGDGSRSNPGLQMTVADHASFIGQRRRIEAWIITPFITVIVGGIVAAVVWLIRKMA